MTDHLRVPTQRLCGFCFPGGLVLAYGLTAVAGAWVAYDRAVAWPRLGLIALGLGLLLLLAWAGGRWGEALGAVALACAGTAAAVGGYYLLGADWHAGGSAKLPDMQQLGAWVQVHRPAVTLPEDIHPNIAGSLLAILLPLGAGGCAWAWRMRQRGLALAGGLAVLAGLAAMALTVSRGAWLGLGAAAAVGLGLSLAPRAGLSTAGRSLVTAGVVIVLALPLLFAFVDLPMGDSLVGSVGAGGTAVSRTALWRDALALIGDYPFTGSGLGSTSMVYSTYALLMHAPYLDHVHSLLLQLAVEQGVLGAVLFAALLGGAAWAAMSRPDGQPSGAAEDRATAALRVAALASLVALAVHGAVDAGLYASKAVPALFLPLGMACAQGAPRIRPAPWVGVVLAAAALVLLLPASQAAFQANLGAISQTRAELVTFHWPETPLQDVLRRPGGVDLAPAEGRFRAALVLDPANVTANRRLGQIALANEDFAAARRYLEAAYRAAPGQRATRQMLGEIAALEGDPAAAAALWQGLDLSAGQLDVRVWWYGHLGRRADAEALRQAERMLGPRSGGWPIETLRARACIEPHNPAPERM